MPSCVSYFTLLLVVVTTSASCLHGTSLLKRNNNGTVSAATFGYTGENGPLNWAGLDPANSACAIGRNQSPIAIDSNIPKARLPPQVNINTVDSAEITNLGYTVQVSVSGATMFEGKRYSLSQYHLHTPSEHRIDEMYYPLEMHMVHESDDGAFLVLAINYELTENGTTTELINNTIININEIREPGQVNRTGKLDFTEIETAFLTQPLPFQYTGSLTTPPCFEGITFLVLENPLPLSVKNYNLIKSVVRFNSRYTQNTPKSPNLIQIAAQSSQLNCSAIPDT